MSPALSVRKLLFIFLLPCLLFVFFWSTRAVYAQQQPSAPQSDPGQPINSTNYKAPQNADYTVMNLLHAALCQVAGTSRVGFCLANQIVNGEVKVVGYNQVPGGGVTGALSGAIALMYTSPASASEYLADVGEHIGIIRTAHAQVSGSGANIIAPIKSLWQFTQKLAYVAFIMVFLVVGFMVMLRRRINPQTVISIQNALPGLVVGLIMVTFSYFISALIIDTSFVSVQLVAQIFSNAKNEFGDKAGLENLARNSNIFDFLGFTANRYAVNASDISGGLDRISDQLSLGPVQQIAKVITTIIGAIAGGFIAGPLWFIGAPIGAATGLFSTNIVGLIVPLVLILALAIQLFRLLFGLIGTYIQILVGTIFGPLYILTSAIPGRGKVLTDWMKGLLANSLVFPAVFALFLFAGAILATPSTDWNSALPLFGRLPTQLLRVLIAYGVMLAAPSIPDAVRNAFGVKGQPGIAQAAIGGFVAGAGVVGAYAPHLGRGGAQMIYTLTKERRGPLGRFANDFHNKFLAPNQRQQGRTVPPSETT